MFDKFLKKVDQIKDEVLDQASKQLNERSREASNSRRAAMNEKKQSAVSSMFGKFTDSLTASTNYLVQVEKMAMKREHKSWASAPES